MARRSSGGTGTLLVALFGIAWLMGRCSGDDRSPSVAEAPPSPSSSAYAYARSPAPLEERFVQARTLNVRSGPDGAIVGRLERGAAIQVEETDGDWARVTGSGVAGWVSRRHTCSGAGCWRPASPPPSARVYYAGDSCPCSGSNNCFGPRGGRYCITSGGNKRYR